MVGSFWQEIESCGYSDGYTKDSRNRSDGLIVSTIEVSKNTNQFSSHFNKWHVRGSIGIRNPFSEDEVGYKNHTSHNFLLSFGVYENGIVSIGPESPTKDILSWDSESDKELKKVVKEKLVPCLEMAACRRNLVDFFEFIMTSVDGGVERSIPPLMRESLTHYYYIKPTYRAMNSQYLGLLYQAEGESQKAVAAYTRYLQFLEFRQEQTVAQEAKRSNEREMKIARSLIEALQK